MYANLIIHYIWTYILSLALNYEIQFIIIAYKWKFSFNNFIVLAVCPDRF